jgi:hypothetical protein
MSEPIAEKLESYDLQRFRNDFRRAMLMHRKGRLTLFFRLYFPMEEPLFGQGRDLFEQLDFRQWLTEPLLEEVSGHRVYRDLVAKQEKLLLLVQGTLESTAHNALPPEAVGPSSPSNARLRPHCGPAGFRHHHLADGY